MNKSIITISRRWNNPQISTTISREGIQMVMSIDDFEKALLEEIGSVTLILTREQFRDKLAKAIANVIQGIKEESIKVV